MPFVMLLSPREPSKARSSSVMISGRALHGYDDVTTHSVLARAAAGSSREGAWLRQPSRG